MTEKVKLTKEQARNLEMLKERFVTDRAIIKNYCENSESGVFTVTWLRGTASWELDLDILIKALYIGYEIEQTPTEKILTYYNDLENTLKFYNEVDASFHFMGGEQKGIKDTLNTLNIIIKGVNA
jgi:hypothetical protein